MCTYLRWVRTIATDEQTKAFSNHHATLGRAPHSRLTPHARSPKKQFSATYNAAFSNPPGGEVTSTGAADTQVGVAGRHESDRDKRGFLMAFTSTTRTCGSSLAHRPSCRHGVTTSRQHTCRQQKKMRNLTKAFSSGTRGVEGTCVKHDDDQQRL